MITVWKPADGSSAQRSSCRSFTCTLFCLESTGDGEFQRGWVTLFRWIQTRRRLPCLSERQWSVHFYLTHWQVSTQLSHTFHFRGYELACMQEWTHARLEQESGNTHCCWVKTSFNIVNFMLLEVRSNWVYFLKYLSILKCSFYVLVLYL